MDDVAAQELTEAIADLSTSIRDLQVKIGDLMSVLDNDGYGLRQAVLALTEAIENQ